MPATIEIFDRTVEGFLEVDLANILEALSPEASRMDWSILDLEATAPKDSGVHVNSLETEVAKFSKHVGFSELLQLSSRFTQVINRIFVGCYGRRCSPASLDDDLKRSSDIAIIADDSSVWIVHAKE